MLVNPLEPGEEQTVTIMQQAPDYVSKTVTVRFMGDTGFSDPSVPRAPRSQTFGWGQTHAAVVQQTPPAPDPNHFFCLFFGRAAQSSITTRDKFQGSEMFVPGLRLQNMSQPNSHICRELCNVKARAVVEHSQSSPSRDGKQSAFLVNLVIIAESTPKPFLVMRPYRASCSLDVHGLLCRKRGHSRTNGPLPATGSISWTTTMRRQTRLPSPWFLAALAVPRRATGARACPLWPTPCSSPPADITVGLPSTRLLITNPTDMALAHQHPQCP